MGVEALESKLKRCPHLQGRQAGFGMVEVLIAAAISGMIIMSIVSIVSYSLRQSKQISTINNVDNFRKNIVNSIEHDYAWQAMINDTRNRSLDCLREKVTCKKAEGPIATMNANGEIVFDATVAENGFRFDGTLCKGFDAQKGNDQCPLRFDMQWRALCVDTDCLNPQVEITGKLLFKPKDQKLILNTGMRDIFFVRGEFKNTLEASCRSMQGQFNEVTQTCVLPMTGSCPALQAVTGFDENGRKVCSPIKELLAGAYKTPCPDSQFAYGFDEQGNVLCRPIEETIGETFPRACNGDEVFNGFKKDGSLICTSIRDAVLSQWECKTVMEDGKEKRKCELIRPIAELGGLGYSICPDGSVFLGVTKSGNIQCRNIGEIMEEALKNVCKDEGDVLTFKNNKLKCTTVVELLARQVKDCQDHTVLVYDKTKKSLGCRNPNRMLGFAGFRCEEGQRVVGFDKNMRPFCGGVVKKEE